MIGGREAHHDRDGKSHAQRWVLASVQHESDEHQHEHRVGRVDLGGDGLEPERVRHGERRGCKRCRPTISRHPGADEKKGADRGCRGHRRNRVDAPREVGDGQRGDQLRQHHVKRMVPRGHAQELERPTIAERPIHVLEEPVRGTAESGVQRRRNASAQPTDHDSAQIKREGARSSGRQPRSETGMPFRTRKHLDHLLVL